jgi:hypothetical protein
VLNQLLADYADTDEWRCKATDFIDRVTHKKNILATVQTLTISQLNVGYFKKGSDALGLHALSFFVSKVNEGKYVRQPHASIWAEMQSKLLSAPARLTNEAQTK